MGSGRCGTTSLSFLLNKQENTSVTHEFCFLPWKYRQNLWNRVVGKLTSDKPPYDKEIIGDCGYYWINYIKNAIDAFPSARFICLWRDRQEVIDSTWEHSRGLNVYPNDPNQPYKLYDASRYNAIGLMWDDYMALSEMWLKKCPTKFYLVEMNTALNNADGQEEMLRFVGYEKPVIRLGIKKNTRGE